jgi:transcriptional regulator with XRE-family HTH domain
MKFNEAIGEVIREKRRAQGVTMRRLSGTGNIALGYLSEIERGQKEPSSRVLEGVAGGLGVEPYELVLEAGIKMYQERLPEIVYIPDTTEWQKQYSDLLQK